ncbi:hypothetical protein CUMW_040800 [Citrus unshiu]|nr:hypothetical protein CUMW_040800 [Citrus unshiu]
MISSSPVSLFGLLHGLITSVADLNAPISINGFSCKLDLEVTSDDFFTDFSKDPTTFGIFKRAVTFGDVSGFPAVNTQGVSLFRIDLDVGRINQPHTHPCGTEAGIITRVKVLLGLVANNNTFFSKVLTLGKTTGPLPTKWWKRKALFMAIFDTQNSGAYFYTRSLISNEVLIESFRVSDDVINAIKAEHQISNGSC